MDYSTHALAYRTMSAFPVSIGTSLALESLFTGPLQPYDLEREKPEHLELADYDEFWVNIMTLYRNILGAVDAKSAKLVSGGDLLETLSFEIDLIRQVVTEQTFGKTKVIMYASNYKNLAVHYPHAKLRADTTPRQKEYTATMQSVLNAYFKGHALSETLQLTDLSIQPAQKTKALMLTHYAHDLLAWPEFTKLDLLESHTGVRKDKSLFYTKFTNGKTLMRIPFWPVFLQVFGDSTLFAPLAMPVRQEVQELADKYHWTALTTKDRVRYGLSAMQDKFTAAILKEMLH